MDNYAVHKSHVARNEMNRLNIKAIMNVPDSPEYNPIEGCFSIVKNHFKSNRLNAMRNGKHLTLKKELDRRWLNWISLMFQA